MRFDLIIVGAGLVGASLAVALRGAKLSIALVDARAPVFPEGWDTRVYAVSPASQRFLAALGAWRHLDAARMAPVYAMQVVGNAGGRLDFSAFEAGVPALATIVESSLMQRELWETVKRQGNLEVFCPAAPAALSIEDAQATLTLADGRQLQGALVVGADGADSWVREQAGLSARVTPYGQRGVVANFACERPHHGTAFQWFRQDGVLAYLPLPGERMSMVWSVSEARAADLMALDAQALAREVAQAGQQQLGALERLAPPAAFPLRLIRVPRVVASRVALLGDAAHAVHPLAGHGVNLGFGDASTLARVLSALPAGRDCGDLAVLRDYERSRAGPVALMQATTHLLARVFAPEQAWLSPLANVGLRLLNRAPIARNLLTRVALET